MSEPLRIVLGLETSCDATAAAVVDSAGRIRSNLVLSQLDEHRPYGGVVPEIAARSHLDHLSGLVERALEDAGVACADLDGVAATGGPGLIGGVFVGVMTAKAIAAASAKPFLAVNHLEGHALSARLTAPLEFLQKRPTGYSSEYPYEPNIWIASEPARSEATVDTHLASEVPKSSM